MKRLSKIVHVGGNGTICRALGEGDEETYSFMQMLKKSDPEKMAWFSPHLGGLVYSAPYNEGITSLVLDYRPRKICEDA